MHAVIIPTIAITSNAVGVKRKSTRANKNTPAATMVAAWINADTGVGPSIASGNHVSKGNCADLPITPQNKHRDAVVCHEYISCTLASSARSNVPVFVQINIRPIRKPASPILLKRNALLAAAAASGLSFQ